MHIFLRIKETAITPYISTISGKGRIMRTTTVKCDRCGKRTDDSSASITIENSFGLSAGEYDVCYDCREKLHAWFTEFWKDRKSKEREKKG